ncbi:MAG: GntR family transcriptional regulator [Blastococcus sp.]|jgi:DNA-binding FadR family transcriptional regulator|nr:GntR family transcriptional regulator [Blastococcus sp.]
MTKGPATTSSDGKRRPHYDAQEQIKDILIERRLEPGSLVPTEAELMAELGVSRTSVREALKGLQARGIVSIEHGRGTFVGRPTMDPLVDGLVFHGRLSGHRPDLATASELVDVREVLETTLVQRVALMADEELIARLEESVSRMEASARSGAAFDEDDRRFHEQLYAPLHNHLVIQLVRAFWDVLEAVRPQLPSGLSDPATDAHHHRVILDRIKVRDAHGAADAMREHFRSTHLWIQGQLPSS